MISNDMNEPSKKFMAISSSEGRVLDISFRASASGDRSAGIRAAAALRCACQLFISLLNSFNANKLANCFYLPHITYLPEQQLENAGKRLNTAN